MSDTVHTKYLYCSVGTNSLTDVNGYKADVPVFFYKDTIQIIWQINDANRVGVNLTGGTFTFNIAGSYNTAHLVTFTSFDVTNAATGSISCVVDMDQAGILALVNGLITHDAYAALWMTLGGTDYCLVNFKCQIRNIIY
jgi:hypothetical protein